MKEFKEINNKLKQHLILGTYLITLYFLLLNIKNVTGTLKDIFSILTPFIVAFAMAFVLNIPMMFFENKVLTFLDRQKEPFLKKLKRPLSILLTFIAVIGLIIALCLFVIPEIVSSASTLLETVPEYMKSFENIFNNFMSSTELLHKVYSNLIGTWQEILKVLSNLLTNSLSGILNTTISITSGFINFILSLVLTIYMLASKETLIRHIKKVLFAFTKRKVANKVIEISNLANITFTKFITGQCIEAFILGFLCFIGMTIFSMPYALLISILIGVTALIPVFGAFIGAIPSIFLILIIDPIKALWFILFIICLQQFEGNVIYPKVVGNSVGLSAIWVMFAMLVGGSTLGLVGMLLGIPTFSVIYSLTTEYTNKKLKDKNIKIS